MTDNSGAYDLDLILKVALNGAEIKQDERKLFLGELRERVLRVLDISQVKAEVTYPEILQAIKDPKASNLLIHHCISVKQAAKYEKPAKQKGLEVTYVCDSAFKGSLGLVVSSDDAVDVKNIIVTG